MGINIKPEMRHGLLGFAIERLAGHTGKKEWLSGMLNFPNEQHAVGTLVPSNLAPIQKFRWSDYRVYPDTHYEYTIHPVYGTPAQLEIQEGPTVAVNTASISTGEHCVLFNRAAAASQAFSRKFPEVEAQLNAALKTKQELPSLPPEALAWLSRGVLEQIVDFVGQAKDATWAIDIAIYEYELQEIVEAVEAAHARGVQVRIVYHAKEGDPQTLENQRHLSGLPALIQRPRLTNSICHHKFIVLSRAAGNTHEPQAVLCGSTNFTSNGVYRQANVVHIVRNQEVTAQYLALFEELFSGANQSDTRHFISEHNSITIPDAEGLFVGFSPRSGGADLNAFVKLIQRAENDVLFCTAFDLFDPIEEALLGAPHDSILRYGLQNTRSKITGVHADRTADFVATAMLPKGLEGFLEESTKGQKGNILIHTKLIITDFTSDSPTVLSGSHNLSGNASKNNDENYLILRGNTDVADCYGCELMRLYDHYRFRFVVRREQQADKHPQLTPDSSWTDRYFEPGNLKMSDRLRFAGEGN